MVFAASGTRQEGSHKGGVMGEKAGTVGKSPGCEHRNFTGTRRAGSTYIRRRFPQEREELPAIGAV